MVSLSHSVRRALRQQLATDRLLGLESVPMGLLPQPSLPAGVSGSTQRAPRVSDSPRKAELLATLNETRVKGCRRCALCETRKQTVFGQGNPNARVVFVGEAPGYEEDKQGVAFVGPAGQQLTRMINAMGLSREEVYICNVLKCRPPGNRDPMADEVLACSPYLREQLSIIEPEMIVTLGAPAAKTLLKSTSSIGKLRGRFHDCFISEETDTSRAIPLMPTYHPAYLLRSPSEKRKTWSDLQMVMKVLGLKCPAHLLKNVPSSKND